MKRIFFVAACLGMVRISWAAAGPISLADLLVQLREHNPELAAARSAVNVKLREVSPAGTWPDPTFTYIDEQFPSGSDAVPNEHLHHLRFEQAIPFPGKLSHEANMKRHEALIAEAELKVKALELERDVRMRYYQLYLTEQKIDLAERSELLLKNALSTSQARLASNQGSASDVFMLQAELGRIQNNLYEQTQQRSLIQSAINALINQPPDTLLGAASAPALVELSVGIADLQNLARKNDPAYQSALHEAEHSRIEMKRRRLEFAPDFSLMYEHEAADAGSAGRQIGGSITFPLWFSRPWNDLKAANAHVEETSNISRATEIMVLQNVYEQATELQTKLTLAKRYQSDILPASLAGLKIAQQQYASGQTDFLRLIAAFRLWIDTHNDYQQQLYEYGQRWAELTRWVGVDLDQASDALGQSELEMNHGK